MHSMRTDKRKLVDKDCALILMGYRTICLSGLPALGAGSRPAQKRDRPDQPSLQNLVKMRRLPRRSLWRKWAQ